MTDLQVQQLLKSRVFTDRNGPVKLVETHISWVLLARDFAYKIKKPHHYSFLDFSTKERRRFYCQQELKLNKRLAPAMYLVMVPIKERSKEIFIGEGDGIIIDYAVKMKRMDETRQMNLLLEKGEVTFAHMEQLVKQLASFHQNALIVEQKPDSVAMQQDFSDILKVADFVGRRIGRKEVAFIENAVGFSKVFLLNHFERITERHEKGFTIDGHGDLYSQNIFLPVASEPVIFDCIEFSDHFRQLDVLNELAFFCMDLEYYNRSDLADYFIKRYNLANPCLLRQEDFNLFQYYKMYRSNVRAKVGALKALQMTDKDKLEKQLKFVKDYIGLMQRYLEVL